MVFQTIKDKCDSIKPLVAIRCITYNHELYIRDALEGFVMQQTKFPFVAIVHDDASTDGTATIIREYAEKYPDIITPIYETENQYSKKDGSLARIMNKACEKTGAKYIALCEGDDYWTDPFKLQKQVDFLENNMEYSMCFHNVDIVKDKGVKEISFNGSNIRNRRYHPNEILSKWIIPTCSAVLTLSSLKKCPKHSDFIVGDNVLWASCISCGHIYGFSEKMAVYRRVQSGWTNTYLASKEIRYITLKRWIGHYVAMRECFPKINKKIFDRIILKHLALLTLVDIKSNRKNLKKYFIPALKKYKFQYIKAIIIQIPQSVISKMSGLFQ